MKEVRIAELKSRLSEHLRLVKRGQTIVILERDTPIARVTALEGKGSPLVIRPRPARALPLAKVPLPPPLELKSDPARVLIEERGSR